ncbi:MAG: SDR family oxidoreductase [Planctomycetota bacterium]
MADDLFSVADQVVVVSGGSRGIGKALAAAFVARDAQVVITGRDAETLTQAANEISTGKHTVRPVVCDVAEVEALDQLVSTLKAEYPRVDTLLNVAGVNKRKKVETFTPEEYDLILDINLRGTFFLSQAIGKWMIAERQGSIITIDSLNTHAPLKGILPYAISKAGVSMMTRGLACEWGEFGVRVNALAPGFVLTDLTKKLWSDPTMQAWGQTNTPLRRLGEVGDMVGTAIFLASKASAFMTGQVVYVDGGFTAGINWPIPL